MGKGCQSYPSPISPCCVKPRTSNPIYKSPAPSRSLEPLSPSGKGQRIAGWWLPAQNAASITALIKGSLGGKGVQLETCIPASYNLSSSKPASLIVKHGPHFYLIVIYREMQLNRLPYEQGGSGPAVGWLRPYQKRVSQKRGPWLQHWLPPLQGPRLSLLSWTLLCRQRPQSTSPCCTSPSAM